MGRHELPRDNKRDPGESWGLNMGHLLHSGETEQDTFESEEQGLGGDAWNELKEALSVDKVVDYAYIEVLVHFWLPQEQGRAHGVFS